MSLLKKKFEEEFNKRTINFKVKEKRQEERKEDARKNTELKKLMQLYISRLEGKKCVVVLTGTSNHSIYLKFLLEDGSVDISVHNRGAHNERHRREGNVIFPFMTITDGADKLNLGKRIYNYLESLLKMEIERDKEDKKPKFNIKTIYDNYNFDQENVPKGKLIGLPEQKTGHCILESHESVIVNSIHKDTYNFLIHNETQRRYCITNGTKA